MPLDDSAMQAFREKLSKAIRDVNTDTALTAEQKRDTIKKMAGISKQDMYNFLNVQYRTGPDISKYVAQFVSKDRPRGGPGTQSTKKSLIRRIFSFR